jgi:hypothetical protein
VAIVRGLPLAAGELFFTGFLFVLTTDSGLSGSPKTGSSQASPVLLARQECAKIAKDSDNATKIFRKMRVLTWARRPGKLPLALPGLRKQKAIFYSQNSGPASRFSEYNAGRSAGIPGG